MEASRLRTLLPIGAGVAGAFAMALVYLGIVSLAGTPAHAIDLFWEDRSLVVPILLGFGVQVGLYTLLRTGLPLPAHAPVNGMTTAAACGVSTAAMVAGCVHHATEVLPLVGLTAAATFLANWKVPFMIAGLGMNLIGIAVMLLTLTRVRRLRAMAPVTP